MIKNIFCALCLLCWVVLGHAQQDTTQDNLLVQEAEKNLTQISAFRDDNENALANLTSTLPVTTNTLDKNIATLPSRTVSQAELTLTDTTLEKIRAFITTRESDIETIKAQSEKISSILTTLTKVSQIGQNPLNQPTSNSDLVKINALITRAEALKSSLEARKQTYTEELAHAKALLNLAEKWQTALVSAFQAQRQHTAKTNDKLRDTQKTYEEKATEFRKRLENNRNQLDSEQQQYLQMGLYHYDDLAWLTRVDQTLTDSLFDQSLVLARNQKLLDELPLAAMQKLTKRLTDIRQSLLQTQESIATRELAYQNRHAIVKTKPFPEDLANEFAKRTQQIETQLSLLTPTLTQVKTLETQKARQKLFENDHFYRVFIEEKLSENLFSSPILNSPLQFLLQSKIAVITLFESLSDNLKNKLVKIAFALLSIIIVISIIYRFTHQQLVIYRIKDIAENDKTTFTTQADIVSRFNFLRKTRFLLYVLDANWLNFGVALSLQAIVYISAVTTPSKELLSISIAVISTSILWLSLVNIAVTTQGFSKQNARTCARLGIIFAIAILLYAYASLISNHRLVIQLYEKGLFLIGIPALLKLRQLINFLLAKRDDDDFLYRIFKWWLRLTPWVLVLCMFIGLLGYSYLAWLMAKRAFIIALMILVMFIGFEALQDLKRWFKLLCIRHVKNGVFVAQDLVSPALTILKLLWVIGCGAFIFRLFEWNTDTPVISHVLKVVNYPLVKLGNVSINIRSLVLTALIAYAVFQVGRWFKSVSYRWLFSHLSDLSIRNSLSIFGQYVVVTASFLIGLQMIGIDLTAFAVFAGALGVGIGLGLQNIAKNFISGLLLLAERPLRTGDTVTIDTAEGEVQRIGMRSITLKTFSSEEVIVPNADVIEKPFKNWTYSDQKLRTELYIGASYNTKPSKVLAILANIMTSHPNICDEPGPMAILWSYDDSAITYRIQYHIEIDKTNLFGTRTEVLSMVWDAFKENNIEIPFPQRDITIKHVEHERDKDMAKKKIAAKSIKTTTHEASEFNSATGIDGTLADDRLDDEAQNNLDGGDD